MNTLPAPNPMIRAFRRLVPGNPLETVAALLLDLVVVFVAYSASLLLRFDGSVPNDTWASMRCT